MSNAYKSFLEKKWVSDKIERRFYNSEPGLFVDYEFSDFEKDNNAPSVYEQKVIITKMEKRKAIIIHDKKFESSLSKKPDSPVENIFRIEILQPGFDEYMKWLKKIEENFDTRTKRNAKMEMQIKSLSSTADGAIFYAGETLKMRGQIKELCRFFMANANIQITIDDIRDEIIKAEKRSEIPNATIAKYVNELHTILRKEFGKDVIVNQSKEGWTFKP